MAIDCTIGSKVGFVGARPPPAKNDWPGDGLEDEGDGAKGDDDAGVSVPPFLLRVEYAQPLVYIEDAQYYYSIAYRMVVDVPVDAVLVILIRPC